MKKYITLFCLLFIVLAIGCQRLEVGFLNVENAGYSPDTVVAYKIIDPESKRAINDAPWTSYKIQGVLGTNPLQYAFLDVKASDGGNADIFRKAALDGEVKVMGGGIIQLFQSAVKKLPLGTYTISIQVSNEGYTREIRDKFTFVIKEEEPLDDFYY